MSESLLGNQRGEVIPGATLRTDAWWVERILVVAVLGSFARSEERRVGKECRL